MIVYVLWNKIVSDLMTSLKASSSVRFEKGLR